MLPTGRQRYLWHVEHQNVVFLRLWGMFPYAVAGYFFRYLLYLAQQTTQRLLPVAAGERSGWCCPTPCKRRRSDFDCCAVVADELQAEFIYEHVEGAKAVAGTRVRSVGIHDDVGIVGSPDKKLHEEPARPAVVASRLERDEERDGVVKNPSMNSMWFLLVTCDFSTRWWTTLPADPRRGQWLSLTRPV